MQLIETNKLNQIIALDDTIRNSRAQIAAAEEANSPTLKALTTARAMAEIRRQLTPELMADVLSLAGSPLGFRTDRDNKPDGQRYGTDVIRDCLIEAFMRGLRPVGNEINIIASRMYCTKEGLRRLVREWPGLTNLKMTFGTPKAAAGGALVPCTAEWRLNKRDDAITCLGESAIPVRVNEGMGVDAIIGKAESKLYRRIYNRLTGSDIETTEDLHEAPAPAIAPTSQSPPRPAAPSPEPQTPPATHEEATPEPETLTAAERESLTKSAEQITTVAELHTWAAGLVAVLPLATDDIHAIARARREQLDRIRAEQEAARVIADAAAQFDGCIDLRDLAAARRGLISEYPDLAEQIQGLAEAARERIKAGRTQQPSTTQA